MGNRYVGKKVDGPGQFTEGLKALEGRMIEVSIVDLGSWSGTVVLQRRFSESDLDWRNFVTYEEPTEDTVVVGVNYEVRLYTSLVNAGEAKLELRLSGSRLYD